MKLKNKDITEIRMANQQIKERRFSEIQDLASWMCAMQAQDYISARYALGLRLTEVNEDLIEKAIAKKEIIRTWPLRNTLHFVSSSDIRWMLSLESIEKNSVSNRLQQLGFTKGVLSKSRNIIEKALSGKKERTREELLTIFNNNGLKFDGRQLSHLMARLAKEQVICFGSNKRKQVTYTLLDDWVPKQKLPARTELLVEITKRYFYSRGPATINDFTWWSGLKISDAKTALKMLSGKLQLAEFNCDTYYMAKDLSGKNQENSQVHLIPWFDEYIVSYKNRDSIITKEEMKKVNTGGGMINPVLIFNGRVCGIWKREIKKDVININIMLFSNSNDRFKKQIETAAERYTLFLGKSLGEIIFKNK